MGIGIYGPTLVWLGWGGFFLAAGLAWSRRVIWLRWVGSLLRQWLTVGVFGEGVVYKFMRFDIESGENGALAGIR